MYFLLGLSLISFAISWYNDISSVSILSMAFSVLWGTCINLTNIRNDVFLKQSVHCMAKTECCLIHKVWSDPASVIWTTVTFRFLSAIMALISLYLSWSESDTFKNGHYFILTSVWVLTCSAWIISSLPMLICLVQCAANKSKRELEPITIGNKVLHYQQEIIYGLKKIRLVKGMELIIRFRKAISLWLLHDIVLGIFWIYLSIELYDLTDDEDDSGWRTIFLSMISWHIMFVIFHHIYIKDVWSCVTIQNSAHQSIPCCAPSEADKWWILCQLLGFAGIYISVIRRMQQPDLINMGCSFETLILFCAAVCILTLGKTMVSKSMRAKPTTDIHIIELGMSKKKLNF